MRVVEKEHITAEDLWYNTSLDPWRSQRHGQYNNVRLLVQKDPLSGIYAPLALEASWHPSY